MHCFNIKQPHLVEDIYESSRAYKSELSCDKGDECECAISWHDGVMSNILTLLTLFQLWCSFVRTKRLVLCVVNFMWWGEWQLMQKFYNPIPNNPSSEHHGYKWVCLTWSQNWLGPPRTKINLWIWTLFWRPWWRLIQKIV